MEGCMTLYELNARVRQVLDQGMADEYWVQAELSEVRIHATGHCYLELVQKDPGTDMLLAKARATIWRSVFCLLKPYFEQATGQVLAPGIRVLLKVTPTFHELYGYSLTVTDIDPSYTLGDTARRRREILERLEQEGVLTLNKELVLPALCLRIAVISSESAAGYGDFIDQLHHSSRRYAFRTHLFPAVMQGGGVEASIIQALETIYRQQARWDAVVIVRGGGATSDLAGFDTYLLAAHCAQFPLPILTGIGHERDDTVVDAVAHTRVKTPTAAAEFLLAHMDQTAAYLDETASRLGLAARRRMEAEHLRLERVAALLPAAARLRLTTEEHRLQDVSSRLALHLRLRLTHEEHRLALLQQRLDSVSPQRLLRRGYAWVVGSDGRVLTDASRVRPGEQLHIRMWKGRIEATVQTVELMPDETEQTTDH
ncbi:MAG: exodeoxyribonuclease VII large subunit [Bacteroidaceae bacterium]